MTNTKKTESTTAPIAGRGLGRPYPISTDSCSVEIVAHDPDDAVRQFAADEGIAGVSSVADLESYLERVGGYGFVDADGVRLMSVAS